MDYNKLSLEKHLEWRGKLNIVPKMSVNSVHDLSIAYTPGVAQPCLEIQKDVNTRIITAVLFCWLTK